MRPALPDRGFALRAALLVAALAAAILVLRGAAQVLPLGLPLAAALVGVLLVPGLACARILGVDEQLEAPVLLAAAIPLGCAVWSLGLMAALIVGLPLTALALIVGVACALALAASTPRIHTSGSGAQLAGVAAAGALMAALASRYETVLQGDALFHAGRVRKLLDLPHLTLSGLSLGMARLTPRRLRGAGAARDRGGRDPDHRLRAISRLLQSGARLRAAAAVGRLRPGLGRSGPPGRRRSRLAGLLGCARAGVAGGIAAATRVHVLRPHSRPAGPARRLRPRRLRPAAEPGGAARRACRHAGPAPTTRCWCWPAWPGS